MSIPTSKLPTISAIVIGHGEPLQPMIDQLRAQTKPPDEIIAVYCCYPQELDVDICLSDAHRGDWGHLARDIGLQLATKDYVMFANSDDEYDPVFIETLLAQNVQFAYCDWNENGRIQESYVSLGTITAGNFVLDRKLAQKVGWKHRDYIADGRFIVEVMEQQPTYARVAEVLYTHH